VVSERAARQCKQQPWRAGQDGRSGRTAGWDDVGGPGRPQSRAPSMVAGSCAAKAGELSSAASMHIHAANPSKPRMNFPCYAQIILDGSRF